MTSPGHPIHAYMFFRNPTILAHRRQRARAMGMVSRTNVAFVASVLTCVVLSVAPNAEGQIPQLPSGTATPIQGGISSSSGAPVDIPQTNLTPIGPSGGFGSPSTGAPPSQLSNPYAIQPGSAGNGGYGTPSPVPVSPGGAGLFSRIFSSPASTPTTQGFGTPAPQAGFGAPAPQVGFGTPSPQGGFGTPAPQGGFGTPAPQAGFGAPVPQSGFGTPAPQPGAPQGGFGAPVPQSGFGTPAPQPGYGGQPGFGTPAPLPQGTDPVYGTQTYAPPTFPNSIYPSSTPSTLFPSGVFAEGGFAGTTNVYAETAFRLFQGPRFRHTFINAGDKLSDVEVNDTDVSLVFAFPRFLNSAQPLYVIPSFSLHLWNGPDGAIGSDLPANAYSAFIDTGWESDPNQMVGTEFGLRIGIFTDFNTNNNRSIRTLGKALGVFRLSPYSTLRGGVYYVDRFSTKLVPAFGVLYQPSPFTRLDFFFPQPKFSRYCRTIGQRDVWFFASGDYGGGSWTIRRTDGTEDSMDMNELRILGGFEWGVNNEIQAGRRRGFFQIGYAFKREIKYRLSPQDDFDTSDAFLVSIGFGY